MKRLLVIIMLYVFVLGQLGSYSPVFAQDCPACDMTPPHLQTYEAVMDELISYIETSPKPNQSGALLAITAATDAALTSLALVRIIPVQSTSDAFSSITLLAGSESLVRDRQMLTRIDRRIANQTLSMIQGSRNTDAIPPETLAKIDESLKKLGYVKLRREPSSQSGEVKYTMQMKGKNGATYGDLAGLLRQINYFYKRLHIERRYHRYLKDVGAGYRRTDDPEDDAGKLTFDPEDLQMFIISTNDLVKEVFAPLYVFWGPSHEWLDFTESSDPKKARQYVNLYKTIWTLQGQYECSRGLKSACSEWKELREEALTLAKDRIINDGGKAINTFKEARGRLKGGLGMGSKDDQKAAQQRKQALLYSQWGVAAGEEKRRLLDVDTHIEPAPQTVSSLWKSMKRAYQKISDVLMQGEKTASNSSTSSRQPVASSQKDAQAYKDDPLQVLQEQVDKLSQQPQSKFTAEGIGLKTMKGQLALEQQTERLQTTFASILSLQGSFQQESIFTDVKRTTHRFPILSAAIYKNIDIIGTKNDNGKLYNAMGSVCDQQCSNLGPTCRHIAN